jgi:hypothetical protein
VRGFMGLGVKFVVKRSLPSGVRGRHLNAIHVPRLRVREKPRKVRNGKVVEPVGFNNESGSRAVFGREAEFDKC